MNRSSPALPGSRGRRRSGRDRRRPLLGAVLAILLVAAPLYAHLALRSSSPESGATLGIAPTTIDLSFTETIELPLSSLDLIGPQGPVDLGELEPAESGDILHAAITGNLVAGSYTVQWQAVGLDGHPVRGEFVFVIEEGAEGLFDPDTVMIPVEVEMLPPAAAEPQSTFTAQSPLYAGARWITYLGIIGLIGAVGFGLLVSSTAFSREVTADFRQAATAGATAMGLLSSAVLVTSLPLRLQAQSHAVFGAGITGERLALLLDTLWGSAAVIQALGILVALTGLALSRRSGRLGWRLAAIGGIAIALTPALSGHAATVESVLALAILSDGLHVLGAGAWVGTLLALVLIGLPLVARLPATDRGAVLYRLVNSFSPIALGAAALVAATGLFAAYLHLTAPADLWTSGYGRILLAKLLLVALVLGAAAFNWRRVRPRSAEVGADARLRRSAGMELLAALLVVGLTAFLVAVPPPADALTSPNPVAASVQP